MGCRSAREEVACLRWKSNWSRGFGGPTRRDGRHKLVGRRGVRKGIVFVAALEGVVLVLVIGGVSLWPDGVEHAESGVDCADPAECLEVPTQPSRAS